MMFQIEVTTHCNFECFYCAGRTMPQRHMQWDLFKSIIDDIPPGRHMVSLQGEGEPTTHPQFWEMAEAVRARGLVPYTITNGAQIDADRVAATFPRIGVSIDTLDAAEAERIGRHKLERVLRNLDELDARMGGKRIHIMTVNYGQPLDAVREFARARGYSHSVQPLQAKPDYAHRYPGILDEIAPRYTYRCRFLERPLKRYYDIEGREYPCCFIKDARLHEPIDIMQTKMAAGELPAGCAGCREVLTPDSVPKARTLVHEGAAAEAVAADLPVPLFSIITTCKGRLEHLKRSLPRMAAQAATEVIVVDYDSPDGAGAWVKENFAAVRVVRVQDAPLFNIARARNLGAAQARGRWLWFVDADVLLDENFAAQALPLLQDDAYYRLASTQLDAYGTFICRRDDFLAIEGYDEILQGWGSEDTDVYMRLGMLNRVRRRLPGEWAAPIAHARSASVYYYEIKDHRLSQRMNTIYVQIKHDLGRQFGQINLPQATLRAIYDEVRRVVESTAGNGQSSMRIEIALPREQVVPPHGWQIRRVLTYMVEKLPAPAASGGSIVADGLPAARSSDA